ncbi:MAG TPA: ATP-dependent protease ATPase subunit HslU [Beijerinckiaceae bacterium]|nr:ATP-dependent protease ATPase subunit HslU [Beijerinckiaceae bacterium]
MRDLVEIAITQTRERKRKDVSARAHVLAEERVVNALVGEGASPATKEAFRKKLRANELDDKEIEIEVQAAGGSFPMFEIPGMPGAQMGAISLGDMFGKAFGGKTKTRRVSVREAYEPLVAEESDKLLDQDALVGSTSSPATREAFRKKLRANELDDKEIEIEVQQSGGGFPMFEIPGMPGAQMGAISIGDIFGKMGGKPKTRRVNVKDAYEPLISEESDKLLDQDQLIQESIKAVEQNGIVFLDEIDKITVRDGRVGGDVSREGVQRDLLPLIEGTTVSTKHGAVKTDHILFIASGAFHVSKPSDLLPELQGRLPIRVELNPLTIEDFKRILTETEASLIKQSVALMATEGVTLAFTEDSIDALAKVAVEVNNSVENIGARRLQTVLERVLDDISFSAPDRSGDTVTIDGTYVRERVEDLAKNADLSRFIL